MTTVAAGSGAISDDWQDVGDVESVKSLPTSNDDEVKTIAPKEADATGRGTARQEDVATDGVATKQEEDATATAASSSKETKPKDEPKAWTSASSTQAALQTKTQPQHQQPTGPAPIKRIIRTLANYKEALLTLKDQLGRTIAILDSLASSGDARHTDLRYTLDSLRQQTASLSQTIYLSTRLYDAQDLESRQSAVPVNASLGEWLSKAIYHTDAAKAALEAPETDGVGAPASELLVLSMTMEEFLPVFQAYVFLAMQPFTQLTVAASLSSTAKRCRRMSLLCGLRARTRYLTSPSCAPHSLEPRTTCTL